MRLSVALCTYNGVRYLDDQLSSLITQSRQPDELIISDDSSSDETVSLLQRFAANAGFPVHIFENESRLGSTQNFAHAIGLCNGDLIALCDQDDIWDKDKLQLTEECFIDNPEVSLVFTDAEIVDKDAQPLGYTLWESLRFDKTLQEQIRTPQAFELLNFRTLVTGATMAFRTEFRDLVLPIPDRIPLIHDGWIALMISLAGRLEPIDRPLMKYRQHAAQQLGTPEIGAPPPASSLLMDSQRRYDFASEISKLTAVRQRLEATKTRYKPMEGEDLDSRLNHLTNRVEMKSQRLGRFPIAFGELFSGRYHRYSNGFYSFIKDLVK